MQIYLCIPSFFTNTSIYIYIYTYAIYAYIAYIHEIVCLFVCLLVCLFVCLLVCLFACLFVCFCLCVWLFLCLFVSMSCNLCDVCALLKREATKLNFDLKSLFENPLVEPSLYSLPLLVETWFERSFWKPLGGTLSLLTSPFGGKLIWKVFLKTPWWNPLSTHFPFWLKTWNKYNPVTTPVLGTQNLVKTKLSVINCVLSSVGGPWTYKLETQVNR